MTFESIGAKGELAHNELFLLLPHYFLTLFNINTLIYSFHTYIQCLQRFLVQIYLMWVNVQKIAVAEY